MGDARYNVKSTMYALLCRYALNTDRNVLAFNSALPESTYLFTAGDINFKIVRKLVGEAFENPGINIVFSDERNQNIRSSPQGRVVHLAINVVVSVDRTQKIASVVLERYVNQAMRMVDSALYGKTCVLLDYNPAIIPPVLVNSGRQIYWEFLDSAVGNWSNNTDLERNTRIHMTKNLDVYYDEDLIL